jgi:polyisoprenoid-binding protein YceI
MSDFSPTPSSGPSSGSATASETTTWHLDPAHSQVEFGVRHMMISTVKGFFTGVEGAIHLDENDLSNSSVEVTIDASSVDTRNEDRDNHLRSGDFLDVETHPSLTFRSRRVEGSLDSFQVTGDLTIRGETREVTFEAEKQGGGTDPWGNQRLGFRGETKVSRKDFGLTWNQALETGGVLVGDEVRIILEVQGVRSEDSDEG